jgi:thiosulfate reductase cytochrome b subunit
MRFSFGFAISSAPTNGVQRLLYMGVIIVTCLAVVTGFSIWKPVQIGWLTGLFGGYPWRAPSTRARSFRCSLRCGPS